MDHFSHQISWKSWFLSEKHVEQRFLTIPHSSFRLCFALRMERSVDFDETIHFIWKSERSRNFVAFHPWICLLSERPKKSHDVQEITDSSELSKNPVHVSRNLFKYFHEIQKNQDFNEFSCSVETQIRLRDAPDAIFKIFIENSSKQHRFDLVFRRGCWFSPFSIKKVLHFPRFFPFLRVLRKTTFRRAYNFPRLSTAFLTPSKMLL